MNPAGVSSDFSKNKIGTPFEPFAMLPPSMSKREPPAHYARELLKEKFGDNYVNKASAKAKRMRITLAPTTIRDLIDERHAKGPTVETLRKTAAVLDVDELEFVSHWLTRAIDSEEFSESQFAALSRNFATLKGEKRERIADYIRMMIREMDRED
jgi:hypothetical protein